MSWFKRKDKKIQTPSEEKAKIPEGLWLKCNQCKEIIYKKEVEANRMVCPKCNYHFPISPQDRLAQVFTNGKYNILYREIRPKDPLNFVAAKKYKDQLAKLEKAGKVDEAIVIAEGKLDRFNIVVGIMDFSFLGGSMGSVVGEKLTRAIEHCASKKRPLIVFSCSGGARMMEGALSLMQMAKVSAALGLLEKAGVPYISVLTHPTTGGVTASFAMLGDLNIAEPGALIGFAGPRVIQQTIKAELPEGFQRSEFLLEHGMVDMVVDRKDLTETLIKVLKLLYA